MAILELDPHGQHNLPMVLEDDMDVTHLGLWVGLYPDGEEDLMLVLQCSTDFTPSCMHSHHFTLPPWSNNLQLALILVVLVNGKAYRI